MDDALPRGHGRPRFSPPLVFGQSSDNSASIVFILLIIVAVVGWRFWQRRHQGGLPSPPSSSSSAAAVVRVATWNLEEFSMKRKALVIPEMARVIRDWRFDVMAAQEIKSDGGRVPELIGALGGSWRATPMSPESTGPGGNGERFVFFYDSARIAPAGPMCPIDVPDAEFARHPYQATFGVGNLRVTLVTAHLFYGESAAAHARRAREMQSLAEYAARLEAGGRDGHVIVLGDLNEQQAYSNIHYFEEQNWEPLIAARTNLGDVRKAETLDNILIDRRDDAIWTHASGVVPYDEIYFHDDQGDDPQRKANMRQAKEQVSDHRPSWADFRADAAVSSN